MDQMTTYFGIMLARIVYVSLDPFKRSNWGQESDEQVRTT